MTHRWVRILKNESDSGVIVHGAHREGSITSGPSMKECKAVLLVANGLEHSDGPCHIKSTSQNLLMNACPAAEIEERTVTSPGPVSEWTT